MSEIASIDEQLELIENLNRRLEELDYWRDAYPRHVGEIAALYIRGTQLGSEIRELSNDHDSKAAVTQQRAFICDYEELWIRVQEYEFSGGR